MDKLKTGIRRYRVDIFPKLKPKLEKLMTEGQRPEILVIACSDSRIKLDEFTQCDPGDLFIVRNAGNIVPPWGVHPSGVAASIEYAISVLPIRDVIIAGHTGCGAMGALCQPHTIKDLPAVREWLNYAPVTMPCELNTESLANVTRENVLLQVEHLREYPCVRDRVAAGKLRLYGWVYCIETGEVLEHGKDGWHVID
ncbi:MAG: carbonic anhydrase [Planctomycetes bacterium]|nr:carbonic anhydrase [Planctomycetota bacterium]MCW8134040.1 carbonic anhydrase [Planctomycetota bacterium]